jgi:hypothetical protein
MTKSVGKKVAESWAYTNTNHKVRRFTQNRPNKKGQVKIEVEVLMYVYGGSDQYHRERMLIDTTIWVKKGNWNNKTQNLSKKEEDHDFKSTKIDQVYTNVLSYINSKGQMDIDQIYFEGVDFSKLRDIYPSRKENRKSFYDLMKDYIENRRSDGDTAPDTIKKIITVANTIKAYDAYKSRKTHIENINFTWSDNFNAWMVGTKKFKPSTIERTYQIIVYCLKHYWKRRDELQLAMNDKFQDPDFKYGKKEGNNPHALSKQQREVLYKHKFDKPYLEKTRKMMCIQAYSACRYSDIKLFTRENFKQKGKLIFTPKKTKRYEIEVVQPLHPHLKQLFEKVDFFTGEIYGTSPQKYGEYIPLVFQELMKAYPNDGFSDDYTSHNMRDTAISIWVQSGVNFKSILRWAGLTKYQTLDHYIQLDDEFERKEMGKTVL